MLNFWAYENGKFSAIEDPFEGLLNELDLHNGDLDDIERNTGILLRKKGYDNLDDIVSHRAECTAKKYETEEDAKYRFVIDFTLMSSRQLDIVCIPNLPDYLSFLQVVLSVQGACIG